MEKERRIRTLNLVALIVAVLGLTIAFAALSKTLTINGTASVDAASWDVHIENLTGPVIEGTAKELSAPSISADGASLNGIDVSLSKPGDSITYTFDVKNSGSINAYTTMKNMVANGYNISKIFDSDFTEGEKTSLLSSMFPVCDWDGNGTTTNDEREKCAQNITFDLEVMFSMIDLSNLEPIEGDEKDAIINLATGQKMSFPVRIEYLESSTELPKGDVQLNIDFSMLFMQK